MCAPTQDCYMPLDLHILKNPSILGINLGWSWYMIFFYLNFMFLLYSTVLAFPYIDMNPPQVYMSSQP